MRDPFLDVQKHVAPPDWTPLPASDAGPSVHLPKGVNSRDPYAIFKLYLPDSIITSFCEYTNAYAKDSRVQERERKDHPAPKGKSRRWRDVDSHEMWAYLGILIGRSIWPIVHLDDYWRKDHMDPQYLPIQEALPHTRCEQIERYFQIGPHSQPDPIHRIKPLSNHIQEVNAKLWTCSANFAVDESMVKYTGNNDAIVTVQGKPIPRGFKLWCLADSSRGFNLFWKFSRKGKGTDDVRKQPWVDQGVTADSKRAVLELCSFLNEKQPMPNEEVRTVWLDNLFTEVNLDGVLRHMRIGCVGTAKSKSGIPAEFERKRKEPGVERDTPWGSCEVRFDNNPDVMHMLWKDQRFVSMQSTIHSHVGYKARARRRPGLSSTNPKTSREVFPPGPNGAVASLPIPDIIDEYNHGMNAVDVANQMRENYKLHRRCNRP